jgi:hypothetical protein
MPLGRDEHYFICNMPQERGFIFPCWGVRLKVLRNIPESGVVLDKGQEWVDHYRSKTPDPAMYQYWTVCKVVGNPNNN